MLQGTFGVLKQILFELGFTMQSGAGGQVRFDHAASDTWFLFRSQQDEEPVTLHNLVAVRRILDEKGILSREQFEARLRSRLIAG